MLPEYLRTRLRVNDKQYIKKEYVKKYTRNSDISGNLYGSSTLQNALIDHFEYKLEHLLKWEDRNSMWFSLEARVPFLDHRLVEKTLALKGKNIIKNGITKSIFREAMKGIVPEKICHRHDKIGFATPQDEWFRTGAFIKLTIEIINSESFRSRNIIDVKIAQILYQNHLNRKTDISKEIWKWIHLELWFREFID